LLLCSSYLPLGVLNWVVICPHHCSDVHTGPETAHASGQRCSCQAKQAQHCLAEYQTSKAPPDDDDAAEARSSNSQSLGFHNESLRLETTREVKGLLDDASNKGSDVQGRQHRRHRPRSMQCSHTEFTIPQSFEPIHHAKAAYPTMQLITAVARSPPWQHTTALLGMPTVPGPLPQHPYCTRSRCRLHYHPLPPQTCSHCRCTRQEDSSPPTTTTSAGIRTKAPQSMVLPAKLPSQDCCPGFPRA
jgi:hypothetical protein